ncbi:MAG: YfhO family protein [Verrucomicrobiota bacterium]
MIPRDGEEASEWFTPGRFAALLGLFWFVLFPDVITGTKTFVVRDFGFFAYPLAHYHRECFWRGEIPLWNPLSMCGLPFLAQWNTLVCYPLSLFYLIFPLSWSLGVFCLGHLFLGGMGMYFLAHRWTGHRFGAAVAGVLFALNGLSLNFLMWPNNSAAFGWMPWVLLLVEQGCREGRRKLLLAALAGAMQMLTGAPEIILLTWLLVAMVCGGVMMRSGARIRMALRFAGIVALVTSLCAVQLLPFLQLLETSQRHTGYTDAANWPMPLSGWANFLVPLFRSFPTSQGVFFQYDQYWTSSYYVPIGALMLIGAVAWRARNRRVMLLAGIVVASVLLAMGEKGGLYPLLRQIAPPIGFLRYPIKFVVLTVFCLPLLAAYAMRHLSTGETRAREWRTGAIITLLMAVAIGGIIWHAGAHPMPNDVPGATLKNALGRGFFLVAALAWLVMFTRAMTTRSRWAFALALLVLFAADILTHAPRQNPTVEPWIYQPGLARTKLEFKPEPQHGTSRAMISAQADYQLHFKSSSKPQDDYLANRIALFSNCNLLDDLPKVNGFFSLYPRELAFVIARLYGPARTNLPPLVDFLGVSHTTQPGEFFQWMARTNFMPLATVGQKPVFADDNDSLQRVLADDFNPHAEVYLPPDAQSVAATAAPTPSARILSQHVTAHAIELEVESPHAVVLVVAQPHYPAWKARVNGQPAALLRANHAFQAVIVPAGKSRVSLRYEDRAFRLGALLSVLTLACAAVAWRAWRPAKTS